MKITAITTQHNFGKKTESEKKKDSFLDKFHTGIKNSADLNDTIQVPRTIFKGYMAFTLSTSLAALAGALKKFSKISTALTTVSILSGIWGTYSFVRPYLVHDNKSESVDKK